jgi:uncharacterized membrane protein YjgN (DUF898 family)
MHQRLKAYQHDNSYFGRTQFSFHARAGQFYLVYLLLLAAIVAFIVLMGVAGVGGAFSTMFQIQRQGGRVDPALVIRTLLILYGAFILMAVSIGPTFRALITNLIWNNTRLGEHRIECNLSPLILIWISVSNLVLVALTLGIFMPWAAVRLVRYEIESMRLVPASDLQEFEAAEPESLGAVGEETATVFDFDISL